MVLNTKNLIQITAILLMIFIVLFQSNSRDDFDGIQVSTEDQSLDTSQTFYDMNCPTTSSTSLEPLPESNGLYDLSHRPDLVNTYNSKGNQRQRKPKQYRQNFTEDEWTELQRNEVSGKSR